MVHEARNITLPLSESYVKEMVSFGNNCLKLLDADGTVIDVSLVTPSFFGASSKEVFHKRYNELLPDYQPDGKPSKETMIGWIKYTLEHGAVSFDWLYKKVGGNYISCNVQFFAAEYLGRKIVCSFVSEKICKKRQKSNKNLNTNESQNFEISSNPKEHVRLTTSFEADERIHAMMDSAPIGCWFYNSAGDVIDCNQHAVTMYEMDSKGEMNRSTIETNAPTYQFDGETTTDYAKRAMLLTMQEGVFKGPFIAKSKTGREFTCEATMVRVKYGNDFAIIVYLRETDHEFKSIRQLEAERIVKQRLLAMLDSSPLCTFIMDEGFTVVDCNQVAVSLFEFRDKQHFIEGVFQVAHQYQSQQEGALVVQKILEAFQIGFSQFEWTARSLTEKSIPAKLTVVRVTIEEKNFVIVYLEDLTEINKYKETERIAQERLKMMLDSSPLLCAIYDKDARALEVNQAGVDFFGLSSKQEYIDYCDKLSPEYQPNGKKSSDLIIGNIRRIFETGEKYVCSDWIHQTLDGTQLPCEVTLVPVKLDGEERIIVHARDMRNHYKLLGIQAATQQKLQAMLNSSPMLCAVVDENGDVLDVNQAAEVLLDLPHKDVYANQFLDLCPEIQPDGVPSLEKILHLLEFAFETGQANFEWMHQTLDGTLVPCEIFLKRVNYVEKDVVIAYVRDLREQKEMLAKIEAAYVQEQLANQAKAHIKIAEESNKAKSRFLARMSHEIRTPITAVLGISEIQLQNQDLPPDMEESFTKIHSSSNILLGVVNDILDFSKIEAGKMTLLCEEYEVAGIVSDAADARLAYIDSKNIQFNIYVDENLPAFLIGDSLRITQIVTNILSNAFKYTKSGSVGFSLRCEKNDEIQKINISSNMKNTQKTKGANWAKEEYTMLVISICDTGIGMTTEQIKCLYNEFSRFHENENRFISGTGLGMPIVYNLVQMMDAKIDVISEVGKGTEVTISIPQKIASDKVIGQEMAKKLQQFESGTRIGAKHFKFVPERMPYGRVLIVDDVEANLHVAKGLLAFYDLNIETCTNGDEAIEKIRQGNVYDIIFMDYMMPELNGTEAMRTMRDLGYTEPIVALTANAIIGQKEKFIDDGFDDFISKPIQTRHLNTILTKLIRDKQPQEVIEAANSGSVAKPENPSKPVDIDSYQTNKELQEKLRVEFVKSRKNAFADISKALSIGDTKDAHLQAHTLKGLAGLINQTELALAAHQIEQSLANGSMPTNEQLSALEDELKRVLESIDIPASVERPGISVLHNKEQAKELFDKLEDLLKISNSECMNYLDEFRLIPEAAILVRQVEEIEFRAALKSLTTLRGIMEV